MQNEAISVKVPTSLYFDLYTQLRKSADLRTPDHIVAIALRGWLAAHLGRPSGRGYQWKALFLPDGSHLRLHYKGTWYYALIVDDQLCHDGIPCTPRDWALAITGSVRNPWRDIWIRRTNGEGWMQADKLREQMSGLAAATGANRRFLNRRQTD